MKKIARFLSLIAVFVTVFAFSCIPTFAADTVNFTPDWYAPKWNFRPTSISSETYYVTGNENSSQITQTIMRKRYYVNWEGVLSCYTNNSVSGGYSYSGTLGLHFSGSANDFSPSTISGFSSGRSYGSIYKVGIVIDGQEYQPFLTKTALDEGTCYLTIKDLYASATNRMLVNLYFSGYTVYETSSASQYSPALDNFYVSFDPLLENAGSAYFLTGTTAGFNDNLNDFNSGMNQGSQKENNLSDKAIEDINSFEFKDIKDDSSILSSLTFYSSVINLAYGSLGSTVQTLFAVSFGVLIVIFILRIRRDSS